MIEIDSLSKNFGGIKAVDNVSFKLKQGSITGLIGPNGCLLYTSPSPRD